MIYFNTDLGKFESNVTIYKFWDFELRTQRIQSPRNSGQIRVLYIIFNKKKR